MCLWVDEPSEVLRCSQPIARKSHTCGECRRTIDPGEKYHYWACLEEGTFVEYKMCLHCRASIVVGEQVSGCDSGWYWHEIWNPDEEMGFIANVLADEHELVPTDRAEIEDLVTAAAKGWREDGTLLPVPEVSHR